MFYLLINHTTKGVRKYHKLNDVIEYLKQDWSFRIGDSLSVLNVEENGAVYYQHITIKEPKPAEIHFDNPTIISTWGSTD